MLGPSVSGQVPKGEQGIKITEGGDQLFPEIGQFVLTRGIFRGDTIILEVSFVTSQSQPPVSLT